jgi:transcriptional regulator with PAS, ATPase and Fis domain
MSLAHPRVPRETAPIGIIQKLLRQFRDVLDIHEAFALACADLTGVIPFDDAYLYLTVPGGREGYWLERSDDSAGPDLAGALNFSSLTSVTRLERVHAGEDVFASGVILPLLAGLLTAGPGPANLGGVVLVTHREGAYQEADLTMLQGVADCLSMVVSHQRLAEGSRKGASNQERSEYLHIYEELLKVISSVPDVRQVLPRISQIAARIVPHDRLTLSFHDADRNIMMQAVSNDDGPRFDRLRAAPNVFPKNGTSQIIDDLSTFPQTGTEPADLPARIVKAGYYSILLNHVSARNHGMSLAFWAKQKNAFSESDIPAAQRMAEQIAVAVSVEQFIESQKQETASKGAAITAEAPAVVGRAGNGRANGDRGSATNAYHFDPTLVVGDSPQWTNVLNAAMRVALTGMTVLLTGESGTGKEVVARFIHHVSPRKAKPFIAVNCAAFPEQLLESEFFGYERGAFTGADAGKVGRIEQAENGVLFLDEISEMTSPAQAKFLRVLEMGEFQRLGGTRLLHTNAQVMAASNRDLKKAVERGDFRQDLYYRLRVFEIRLPALRDRRSDIIPLAEGFLRQISTASGRETPVLNQSAKDALVRYEWRGNVRELRNTIERAALVCNGKLIHAQDLLLDVDETDTGGLPHHVTDLNRIEKQVIDRVMRECGGNKSKAARMLGLSRTQLYVRLRKS